MDQSFLLQVTSLDHIISEREDGMELTVKKFSDLSTMELFELYRLRNLVFIVEQNCPYQDIDAYDLSAYHVCLRIDDEMVGYARIYRHEEQLRIGRVVVHPKVRHQRVGSQLMRAVLDYSSYQYKGEDVYISAQTYVQNFYEGFGFAAISEVYLEDGIEHIDMCLVVEKV